MSDNKISDLESCPKANRICETVRIIPEIKVPKKISCT